jgi:integrase/recombinase XerD
MEWSYGDYLDWLRLDRGVQPQTIKTYTVTLRTLPAIIEAEPIRDWWHGFSGNKPKTQIKHRTVCLSYLYWLREQPLNGELSSIEAAIKALKKCRPPLYQPLTETLTRDEVGRLLAAPDASRYKGKRDLAILLTLYASLRLNEVVRLELADLHLAESYLIVKGGKRCKDRIVPLEPETIEALNAFLALPWHAKIYNAGLFALRGSGIGDLVRHYSVKALGRVWSPHDLRRARATHWAMDGVALPIISAILGHSNLATTQIYIKVSTADVLAAILKKV